MKLPILNPSRCTSKLPDDLSKEYLVAEEKIDGSRYLLYMGEDPYGRQSGSALLSRRISVIDNKHVDRTGNVPHITKADCNGLEGTVVDGEIQANDFLSTNSIMNSSPSEAIRKQKNIGLVTYRIFDVMFFRGIDVRNKPLMERRKILEAIADRMNNPNLIVIPQIKGDIDKYFTEIVNRDGEGVIVKDLRMGYGVGWAKMKKSYDVSCVISGFKPGNGKYSGGVGSVALSVYHDDALVEVGFASGFDDKVREDMRINPKKYLGKVVDVFIQEIQESKRSADNPVGRTRHPTFYRFRDDLNAEDCTSQKLWDDIKAAKTRNRRNKGDK